MSHVAETRELEPINFTAPDTFAECLTGGASALGMSSTSAWLSCPQYSYLSSLGLRQKRSTEPSDYGLNALAFGTLFHTLRAHRIVHGQEAAEAVLRRYREQREMGLEDEQKAMMLLRVYNQAYPIEAEPFEILGVECTVYTNIRDWWGRPLFRSVRYDTVVRMHADGAIFSLECKTAAKSGRAALNPYMPQGMSHSALWNANPHLVAQYGEMQGTIWDHAIKTTNPKADRVGPEYFTKFQQQLALDYLRLPEAISMPKLPDGSYPKFLHTCWGRWSPCAFIDLCHNNASGDYERLNKETGEVTPYYSAEAA